MDVGAWVKGHKPEAALGVGGIVVAIALYMRSKANASGTSSTATPSSVAYPSTVADTTGTDVYNGLEDQIQTLNTSLAGLSGLVQGQGMAQGGAAAATPAPASSAPIASTALASPGEGIIPTAQGSMIVLGTVAGGPGDYSFSGYNVGGGAPVYYGDAQSEETGAVESGFAYTPEEYGSFVSPTAVSGEHIG